MTSARIGSRWLCLLLPAFGCGGPVEEAVELRTGQEPLYIDARGGGWQGSGSRAPDAEACRYTSGTTCYFSGYSHTLPAGRPELRGVKDLTISWPSSMNAGVASLIAADKAGGSTYSFEPATCNSGACVDLYISSDANIASPNTLPNTDQPWRQFVRFHCNLFQELEERVLNLDGSLGPVTSQFGIMRLCTQLVARVDVSSFVSWVNLWATSNTAKQVAQAMLYTHIYAVAAGMGAAPEYNVNSVSNLTFRRNNTTSFSAVFIDPAAFCVGQTADIHRYPGVAAFSQTSVCN